MDAACAAHARGKGRAAATEGARMELHQLKYLSAIARCGSVAKASDELYVSRQAISKAIRALEQEVGFEIFDRGDKMSLTESGKEILRHADAVLHELNEIDMYADSRKAGFAERESLAIAFKSFPLDYLFFNAGHEAVSLVNTFAARTPGCAISTYKLSDTAILNALQEGSVDIGFVQGEYERQDIKLVPVSVVETRVITLRGNPICEKAPIRIADLGGVPIRSPFDFDLFTHRFIALCREHGFDPLFREVPLNDEGINDFCGSGGVHLQPYDQSMETEYPESIFMPFHPSDRIDLPLCLAYSEKGAKPQTAKFVNFFKSNMPR